MITPSSPSLVSHESRVFRMVQASGDRMAGSVPVWGRPETPEEKIAQRLEETSQSGNAEVTFASALAEAENPSKAKKEDGFGFLDLLDVINPLQHIPVVGTLYRALTGDEIKPAARIIGDTAFGGVVGAVTSIADTIVENATGKDVGGHVASLVGGKPSSTSSLSGTTIALADLTREEPIYNS